MRLYRNVSKFVLAIKTPRWTPMDPGMVLDIDIFEGGVEGTDVQFYIDRGMLRSIEAMKKARAANDRKEVSGTVKRMKKEDEPKIATSTTKVERKNKTIVVSSTKKEEVKEVEPKMGRIIEVGKGSVGVMAPPDEPKDLTLDEGDATPNADFDNLPAEIKENIKKGAEIDAARKEAVSKEVEPKPKRAYKRKPPSKRTAKAKVKTETDKPSEADKPVKTRATKATRKTKAGKGITVRKRVSKKTPSSKAE